MKKIVLLSSLLAVCAISLQAEVFRAQQYEQKRYIYEDRIKIRSNKLGNWYVLGETVTFSSAHQFSPKDKIHVILTDYEGSVFQEKTLSGKEFNEKGWNWKSDEPGYYEVKFYCNGKPVSEGWDQPIWKMNRELHRYVQVGREKYERAIHSIVVTAEKTKKPYEIAKPFSLSDALTEEVIEFAALVGFRGIRIQGNTVGWELIEPKKGKFNWGPLDKAMGIARKYHFSDADMIFNPTGVPRWASSRPNDNTMVQSGYRNYKNCLPANLKEYENFLLELHHFAIAPFHNPGNS